MALSILLFGRDPQLLKTRQWVLQSVGYQVATAADCGEISQLLFIGSRFDLLVLCHTLSDEDCRHSLALTNGLQKMKKLELTTGNSDCHAQMINEVLDAKEGPARLLSTVRRLINPEVLKIRLRDAGGIPALLQLRPSLSHS